MSVQAQQEAVLDLLFDASLRAQFLQTGVAALAVYGLSPAELHDFAGLRGDGLQLDAAVRTDLILAQLCRSYPLLFSALSSLPGGKEQLQRQVDSQLVRLPVTERPAAFGLRVRDWLHEQSAVSAVELQALTAVLDAEVGMAWAAAQLLAHVQEQGSLPVVAALPVDWTQQPLRLAPFVTTALLPQPHALLRKTWCPCAGADLWLHLGRQPLSAAARQAVWHHPQPRLLVARATLVQASTTDPVVEQVTVELSEGFAPLFEHVDGSTSVQDLLMALQQEGAPVAVLQGVQAGFRQLLQAGMLQLMQWD